MPKPTPYTARDGTTTWRVRFRHRGRQTSETFTTERDANRFCRTLTDYGPDHAVRVLDQAAPSDAPTLDELFPAFIDWKAARVRSARTTSDYARDWHRWVAPTFGHTPADTITPGDVQRWVDRVQADGAAPKSIHDRHALLAAVYRWATQREHVPASPCLNTDLPPKRKGDAQGLEPSQWETLHRELHTRSPHAADLAAILVGSGMRWSEATALHPEQVKGGRDGFLYMTVSHVMRRNNNGSVERVHDTKSIAGRRTISMLGPGAPVLERLMDTRPPGAPVSTPPGGGVWHYSPFRRVWVEAVKAARITGQKATPHGLRHTHAYWLIRAGVPLVEVQRRLGHANISTTVDTYGRMVNDVTAEGAARFNAIAGGAAALEG